MLGFTLYSDPAAYAIPHVVIVTLSVQFMLNRTRRPALQQVAAYAVAFAATALPLAWYAINHSDQFGGHIQNMAANSITTLFQNASNTVIGLFFSGGTLPYYDLPGRALLDGVQSVLFVSGLWLCVRHIKQSEFSFPLIWSGIMLIPAVFSISTPAFGRMVGAVPGILLIVALGGLQTYQWLARLRWKWVAPVALIRRLAFTTLKTAYDYFEVWPHAKGFITAFSLAERIQAEAIKAYGPAYQTYLSPSDSQRSIFAYLWQDQTLAHSFNGRRCTIVPRQTRQDTRGVLNALEDKRTVDRLSALYPSLSSRPCGWRRAPQ